MINRPEQITMDRAKYDEMIKIESDKELKRGKLKGTTTVKGIEYAIHCIGWEDMHDVEFAVGHQVVDIQQCRGDLKPLFYPEHRLEAYPPGRSMRWNGIMVRYKKRTLVLIGETKIFICNHKAEQATLF